MAPKPSNMAPSWGAKGVQRTSLWKSFLDLGAKMAPRASQEAPRPLPEAPRGPQDTFQERF
eukprot:11063914-Karenia_brevis.AAC.1